MLGMALQGWTIKPARRLYDLGEPVDILIDHHRRVLLYRHDFEPEPLIRAVFELGLRLGASDSACLGTADASDLDDTLRA